VNDQLFAGRAGVPGIPLHFPPHPAHRVLAHGPRRTARFAPGAPRVLVPAR
jgi:hypothetical protein